MKDVLLAVQGLAFAFSVALSRKSAGSDRDVCGGLVDRRWKVLESKARSE